MPPKQRRSKASSQSSAAVVDALSTKDMSKDQLWEQAILLQEELARGREEKTNFKLERDKNLSLWEISKKTLEEAEAQLRSRRQGKEEAKERHRGEICSYELKLKHVQLEQHNAVTKLKLDAVTAASEVHNHHTQSVLELRRRIQDLKAERREKIAYNEMRIKQLKLAQQMELMELNKGYKSRMQEMGKMYNEKMCSLIETEDKKTREELEEVDERMRLRVLEVEKENEQKLQDASEYEPLLLKLSKLKEDEQQAQKENDGLDRKLSAAKEEKQRLTEHLRGIQLKGPDLQKQLRQLQDAEARSRTCGKLINEEIRHQMVKNELLRQAVEKVQLELYELLKSHQSQMLKLQERRTLKEMLLPTKIANRTHQLQRLQLEPGAATGQQQEEKQEKKQEGQQEEEQGEEQEVQQGEQQEQQQGEQQEEQPEEQPEEQQEQKQEQQQGEQQEEYQGEQQGEQQQEQQEEEQQKQQQEGQPEAQQGEQQEQQQEEQQEQQQGEQQEQQQEEQQEEQQEQQQEEQQEEQF